MKLSFVSRLRALADDLFDQPLTPNYWLWVIFYLVIGFVLLQPSTHLPDLIRDVAIGSVMVGLARLFNSTWGRWAWGSFMGLLLVLMGLDVAIASLG